MKVLRKCKCGEVAITEDDLELFEVDSNSKYGRRNRCKKCAAEKTRGGVPKKPKGVRCTKCREVYSEEEAYRYFRRAKPTGDLVVGHLLKVCKACENTAGYVEIGGRLIPSNLNDLIRESRITSKPSEAV